MFPMFSLCSYFQVCRFHKRSGRNREKVGQLDRLRNAPHPHSPSSPLSPDVRVDLSTTSYKNERFNDSIDSATAELEGFEVPIKEISSFIIFI